MTADQDQRPEDEQGDDEQGGDEQRVAERAHLLPEELAAGSDDPTAQAEQILAESDERTAQPERTQRESPQTDESTASERATERSV